MSIFVAWTLGMHGGPAGNGEDDFLVCLRFATTLRWRSDSLLKPDGNPPMIEADLRAGTRGPLLDFREQLALPDPELTETYEAILRDYGEVVQLIPLVADVERWILENLERSAVWFGDGVLVELPYIHPILDAMESDGINVRISVES